LARGAALVLEAEDNASARGAPILAELCGVAPASSDAFHWTQPSLEGAVSAMRQACEAGGFEAGEMLISTHGTGTPLNDKNEAAAIRELFGIGRKNHPVIATKSAHGHVIGAASAVQA
jgi:nodulation protein E